MPTVDRSRLPWLPALVLAGLLAAAFLVVTLAPAPAGRPATDFRKTLLANAGVDQVTTLQFGPDGKLYVGQKTGIIRVLTIEREVDRSGRTTYRATSNRPIGRLIDLENHDDQGTVAEDFIGRLLTGLFVTGTAERPVLYAATSDPRIGGGLHEPEDTGLDTNSGVLSRLSWTGSDWVRHDLVRGLPRSQENHASNGLALSADGRTLYLAQGGNTNNGAPAKPFIATPEYALSGAVLAFDLAALGETTYDLPTLDDPTRPGPVDAGDPFGGNRGLNQAKLVPGGPVSVYAPGFRNPYDVVRTAAGHLYTVDNGSNKGWGAPPAEAGGKCTNALREGGVRQVDVFHRLAPGYYGGHPNPTRANPANRFAGQIPAGTTDARQCRYRVGTEAGLATFPFSTNGLAEYTASAFDGELAGDLLAVGFDAKLYRLDLDEAGDLVGQSVLADHIAKVPLDVTTQGDDGAYPGTIWVGDIADGTIAIYEPVAAKA